MSLYTTAPEQWDRHVEEYRTIGKGFAKPLILDLLAVADAARPFSTSTGILDNGCGTGNLTAVLIEEYGSSLPADVSLVASDYSKGMVAVVEDIKADPENASNPLWQKLKTHVLDAVDLLAGGDDAPITPASLSHILANLMIFAVGDYKAALLSAHAALEDGGVFACTSVLSFPWVEAWAYARPLAPDQDWSVDVPVDFRSVESVTSLLRRAGFSDVTAKATELPLVFTEPQLRVFINNFIKSSNPLAVKKFSGWPEAKVAEAIDMIVAGVGENMGGWPVTLKGQTVTACARK